MSERTVTTQAELDQALADQVDLVYIDSPAGVWLDLADSGSSRVVARGSSRVVAWGSSHVEAWGRSQVVARDSSRVEARDSSRVEAGDSSRVEAGDSSQVEAGDSSQVEARDRSRVVAWDRSWVVAWGRSQVEAWDRSQVEAWGRSQVEAWDRSQVEAWGRSWVVAWGRSRVVATPHVAIHLHSARATATGGVIIDVTNPNDVDTWLAHSGITTTDDGHATLFKAVNQQLVSGYGFTYPVGGTVTAPDWRDDHDCGGGLHVSPTPRHALDYHGRSDESARFLAVRVAVADIRPIGWDKCKVPSLVVLHEVDVDGKPVVS